MFFPVLIFKFDMIFADPPYFLSNGGISYQAGKIVCVDKGDWDKGGTPKSIDDFNRKWLSLCRDKLKENGTIWISGTHHNIFSIANIITELGYRILNVITWAKTNPPPNISRRFFTYSTEFIIWARKTQKTPHKYNYALMKSINGGKQMTDVWRLPAIARWEKSCGKHPTQNRFPCFLELFWQVQMPTTGFSILLQVRLQLVSRLTYVADDFLELKKKQNSRLLVEHVESK